jgi:hypothetical protein
MLPMLIYGWRQYFFYLPLPFIIAATFDRESLLRFGKHALVAVIFTAPLVLAQYASPASAVINRGSSDDVALQFKAFDLLGDRIRPSGLFTTNVGVKELVASSAALLFAAWLTAPAQRRMSHLWLLAGAAGIAACLAVSGSRAAFAHVALVVIAAMGVGVLTRNPQVRIRALTVPLALCALGAILYPIVFPDALQTMLERVVAANASESRNSPLGFLGRVLADYIGFIYQLGDTPVLGWGLGLGGNGRTFLGDTSALPLERIYAESEWTRHIVDLGMVGVLLILYRIAAFLALLSASLRATRVSQSPFPLLLFGYAGYLLLGGQVTGQGTVGGFAWLFIGLCMAACRTSLERR